MHARIHRARLTVEILRGAQSNPTDVPRDLPVLAFPLQPCSNDRCLDYNRTPPVAWNNVHVIKGEKRVEDTGERFNNAPQGVQQVRAREQGMV